MGVEATRPDEDLAALLSGRSNQPPISRLLAGFTKSTNSPGPMY